MKLDVNQLRYLSKDEFRTLQAIELGQKNHELVPVPLADSIAGLRQGGTVRCLRVLLRAKLVHHDNSKYDGYRLTNLGYDYLALNALVKQGAVAAVGRQIGVGKESDVFEVLSPEGERLALKLHRLGRTSFRAVQSKRDYLKHRTSFSWLYLSRLAALKEHAFMAALGERGFPVPVAVAHNRHAVLMSLVDGVPLNQVKELGSMGIIFRQCLALMVRLAELGLVHCDFNEFNLLVGENEEVTLIDFPQMISTSHANAAEWFDRDVACLVRFFTRKMGYIPDLDPHYEEPPTFQDAMAAAQGGLDIALGASGFKRSHQTVLEQFAAQPSDNDRDSADSNSSDESATHQIEALSNAAHDSAEQCSDAASSEESGAEAEHWEGRGARQMMRDENRLDSDSASSADSRCAGDSQSEESTQTGAASRKAGNAQDDPASHADHIRDVKPDGNHSSAASERQQQGQAVQAGAVAKSSADAQQDLTGDAEHDRLCQVRRQIVAERRTRQKQSSQVRAAKGARQAAARKGRKTIAQSM